MKKLTILVGILSILLNPAWAAGKIYEYTDEQGNKAYTDSLKNVPDSQAQKYKLISDKTTTLSVNWASAKWVSIKVWIKSKRDQAETLMLGMSTLERLMMGIGLAFFSLGTIYVLLFKSAVSRSFSRILFRLALILIVITSSSLSYLALTQSLISPPTNELTSPQDSIPLSEVRGRVEGIKHLEKEREKMLKETTDP